VMQQRQNWTKPSVIAPPKHQNQPGHAKLNYPVKGPAPTPSPSSSKCPACEDLILIGNEVILFPCGHVFCPTCSESVRKCPFCRVVIASRTIRRNDTSVVVTPGEGDEGEVYLQKYRESAMKKRALLEKRRRIQMNIGSRQNQLIKLEKVKEASEKTLEQIEAEMEKLMFKAEAVQKEKIEAENELETIKQQLSTCDSELVEVAEALRPTLAVYDKNRIMISHFRPDIQISDDDEFS